jgi:hypothetical protein
MKDGRVLKYNDATTWVYEGSFVSLRYGKNKEYTSADIALCDIDRIEFNLPCKIYQSKPQSKLPKI